MNYNDISGACTKKLLGLVDELAHKMISFPTGQEKKTSSFIPKAILFDIYGTLLISGSGDVGTAREKNTYVGEISNLLHTKHITVPDSIPSPIIVENLARFVRADHKEKKGKGCLYPEIDAIDIWGKTLHRLQDKFYIEFEELDPDEVAEMAFRHEFVINPVNVMPGAEEILSTILQKGIEIGIISNAQFYTPIILEGLFKKNLSECGFKEDLIEWSYKINCAKPSPKIFENVLNTLKTKYNISAEETLYIGNDILNDIKTAASLNMKTMLFAGDKRSLRLRTDREDCRNITPDFVVQDLKQIEELWNKES